MSRVIKCSRMILAAIGAATALVSCNAAEQPFLMVQICLSNSRELNEFAHELHAIALSQNMTFIDRSSLTRRNLEAISERSQAIGAGDLNEVLDHPVINMGAQRADSMGVSAGNIGLPGYQVVLGFSEGSNAEEARQFADYVLERLSRRWRVERVPAGQGAMPLSDCPREELP